jgi:hypothetical protein
MLRLERRLSSEAEDNDDMAKEVVRLRHSLEERNQHVSVLTETIDALQSTTTQTTDQIALELERQAGEEVAGLGTV